MPFELMKLGKTRIHYQLEELFRSLSHGTQQYIFRGVLEKPLSDAHVMIIPNDGKFDVLAWFSFPPVPGRIKNILELTNRFASPYGPLHQIKPYDAYEIIVTGKWNFVLSCIPESGEFLLSTNIALTGIESYAYVLKSPPANAMTFQIVFTAYVDLLRELIDFIYSEYTIESEQNIRLHVLNNNGLIPSPTVGSNHSAIILPFVRPARS